jgi:hypothetical protein
MQQFRAYCLSCDNRIVWGTDIEAINLAHAVRMAREMCSKHPQGNWHWAEIWQQGERIFTSAP